MSIYSHIDTKHGSRRLARWRRRTVIRTVVWTQMPERLVRTGLDADDTPSSHIQLGRVPDRRGQTAHVQGENGETLDTPMVRGHRL